MEPSKVLIQSGDGEFCCIVKHDLSAKEARELAETLNDCLAAMKLKGIITDLGVVATVETPL